MKAFQPLMIALALVCFMSAPAMAYNGWTEVKAEELKDMMQEGGITVIFPLSKIEYNNLHIEGSIHIPFHELAHRLPADKRARIVFYCLGRR